MRSTPYRFDGTYPARGGSAVVLRFSRILHGQRIGQEVRDDVAAAAPALLDTLRAILETAERDGAGYRLDVTAEAFAAARDLVKGFPS